MIKIGITGGIASGKSTLCRILECFMYKVWYADIEAKKLANENKELKKKIISHFGKKCYIQGKYDYKYVFENVFKDEKKRIILENLFSEYIIKNFEKFCQENSDEKYIFFESALIFEKGREKLFDYIICVYANEKKVRSRLKNERNYTDSQIEFFLNSQMNPAEKISRSDFVIDTSNNSRWDMFKQFLDFFVDKIEKQN